jgi:hypothetical protein
MKAQFERMVRAMAWADRHMLGNCQPARKRGPRRADYAVTSSQIAKMVARAGGTAVNTDYIMWLCSEGGATQDNR